MRVADWIVRRLAAEGVREVFLVPGGAAMHLNDALAGVPEIEAVATFHEQASAIAAEAAARITNRIGVCMVTAGPGGTNAVTGTAGAYLDSMPVLFLSGQVKRADLKRDTGVRQLGVQEIDIVSIVSPITKYAVTVTEPADIRFHLEKALHLARSGRRGPVWLDLPLDVQGAPIDESALRPYMPEPAARADSERLAAAVGRVVQMLKAAERPVIIAGNGIRMAGAAERFASLVARLGIPVLTTWLGIDLLADDHPLFFGRPGAFAPRGANFTLQNSDFLLAIGTRLDMALTGYAHERFARAARKAVVDIDAAEIAKLKMNVELPVVADAGDFLRELDRQSAALKLDYGPWLERARGWKAKYPVVTQAHFATEGHVTTYAFSEALSRELAEGDIVASGASGAAIEVFLLALRMKAGQRCFHNRGLGAMGYGLPSAIGACVASGRKRTVCVDGDGGFQLNVQELETVVRLRLPIKIFILDNQGYASIRASQTRHFGRRLGSDPATGMTVPDNARIAGAYGLPTSRIDDPRTMQAEIRRVLEAEGPMLCTVVLPADEPREPAIASIRRPDGSMASTPLEDLAPFLPRDELRANMLIPLEE